jgi:hypothetical protein
MCPRLKKFAGTNTPAYETIFVSDEVKKFLKILHLDPAQTLEPWCQFHQYFTGSFFIQKFFAQLLHSYNLGL